MITWHLYWKKRTQCFLATVYLVKELVWVLLIFRPPGTAVPCSFTADVICHIIWSWFNFVIQLWKLGGPPPKNCAGQKRAKFGAILENFKLWSPISQEWIRSRYRKSERHVIVHPVFGEKLFSQLFWKSIFWPLEVLPPQIFTHAREWPRLANPHSTGDDIPITIFNNEDSKIGLKFSALAIITLQLGGITSWNFATWCTVRWVW